MKKKVDKWQEPAPAKQHKVLPVPDMEPKKRRGGRRFRKMKERYGLTDMRKAANRCVDKPHWSMQLPGLWEDWASARDICYTCCMLAPVGESVG
jgi:hypothetical protein